MPLTKDEVRWAYKILLGREPESVELIEHTIKVIPDLKSFRKYLFSVDEFIDKNRDILKRLPAKIASAKAAYRLGEKSIADMSVLNEFVVSQGIYEELEIGFIVKQLREGNIFLDVGGGRGIHSVVAALCVGEKGRVYTVEADPRCIALINRNAAQNEVEQRIEIVRAVVRERTGETNVSAESRISVGVIPAPNLTLHPIQDTLDNILKDAGRINIFRIDQSGADILSLQGANHILNRDRPLVLAKIEPDRLEQVSGNNWQYYFGLMAQYGYKPHILDEDGLGKTHPHLEPGRTYSVVFSTTGHYIG